MSRLGRLAIAWGERVSAAQVVVARWALVAISIIMCYGVVMRYVFRQGIPWAWELPGLLFLIVTTLGLAYAQVKRRHVRVDLLLTRLPIRTQRILEAFAYIVFCAYCVLLLRAGVARLITYWTSYSDVAKIYLAPIYIFLPIGLATLIFVLLVDIGKTLNELLVTDWTRGDQLRE